MNNEKITIETEKVLENNVAEVSKWRKFSNGFKSMTSKLTRNEEKCKSDIIELENDSESDETIKNSPIMKAVDKIYGVVVDGKVPGTDSAKDLAINYLEKYETPIKAANTLVRWQNTKAAVDGAITGFGGFATMIATPPINVSSILFIQIRMIAAIAYIGGIRDLRNDQLQTAVKCCLLGESVQSFLKKAGIKTTEKVFVKKIMPKITRKMITKINRAIGFRFLTKGGSTGIVNIGKMVPVLGCVVGSIFDGVSTNIVGNAAIKTFIMSDMIFTSECGYENGDDISNES